MRAIILIIILLLIVFIPFFQGEISLKELMNFILIIFLGTIALFQDEFKKNLTPPKLKIDFKLEPPYYSKTPIYISWISEGGKKEEIATEAFYFKAKVTNIGKTQAKLCEVFITDLEEFKADRWQTVSYFQQVNLKWATGKSQDAYLHINPSISLLVDVGLIIQKNIPGKRTDVFWLEYLYRIGGYQPEFLEPNMKYRFKMIVSSENAKPIYKVFELTYTGQWKPDPSEMRKEITIKPI